MALLESLIPSYQRPRTFSPDTITQLEQAHKREARSSESNLPVSRNYPRHFTEKRLLWPKDT